MTDASKEQNRLIFKKFEDVVLEAIRVLLLMLKMIIEDFVASSSWMAGIATIVLGG